MESNLVISLFYLGKWSPRYLGLDPNLRTCISFTALNTVLKWWYILFPQKTWYTFDISQEINEKRGKRKTFNDNTEKKNTQSSMLVRVLCNSIHSPFETKNHICYSLRLDVSKRKKWAKVLNLAKTLKISKYSNFYKFKKKINQTCIYFFFYKIYSYMNMDIQWVQNLSHI